MARLIVLTFAVFVLLQTGAAAAGDVQQRYDALVAQVKGGDTDIDYAELRNSYSETPDYNPYDAPKEAIAMSKAFSADDCAVATVSANKILETNFPDLRAHAVLALCSERGGDVALAGTQRSIVRGLLNSIARSGDGQSPDTAFAVIAVREEYDFLGLQGFRVKSQSLVASQGHQIDALEVTDEDGKVSTYFFNVDKPFAWMAKAFAPKLDKAQ